MKNNLLPQDYENAFLIGRVYVPNVGPCLVYYKEDYLYDITELGPTMSHLLDHDDPISLIKNTPNLNPLGELSEFLNPPSKDKKHFLAPVDLQAIKAAGVTFATSMLERIIEEQAKGDPTKASTIREEIKSIIGMDLSKLKPGSKEAMKLKEALMQKGMWSQYLEVGIGPDAEIFTKSQPMSAVGHLSEVGIHPKSTWNNPEPEIVLVMNKESKPVGATLGNDVNLRDFEGRSALLLGKAKDNNASCALGPFIRFFDNNFTIDDIRKAVVHMEIEGKKDGFFLEADSTMELISRDPLDLVEQANGNYHQYPDGFVLFLGTLFAPTQDRDQKNMGFTHKIGDRVTISTPKLGTLTNYVDYCDKIYPWTFGVKELIKNLKERNLI